MRNFSKRGISDVVTTVLIILLVLAAVVIVWSFIRPQLDKTGQTIDAKTKCLNVGAEVVSCVKGTRAVTYKVSGDDAGSVKFIITNSTATGSQATSTVVGDTSVSPTETVIVSADYGGNITKVAVAAVVEDTEGNDYTCDASPVVTCTA